MAASFILLSILGVLMIAKSSQAQERIGCFSFNHANTVLSVEIKDPVESINTCIQQCRILNATYAGVRYGYNCYCGDNHNHTVNGGQLNGIICNRGCNDHRRLCGGPDSIAIYSVCSRGLYRDNTNDEYNCDASCNCEDNGICLYSTGSCPANCETGWSGEACNMRVHIPPTQPTTIQSEDEDLASSDGVSEHMTANPASPVTHGCPDLLVALCVTSVGLVISIIVNINLVYRLRVARIHDKQSSANIRANCNISDRNNNDAQYENIGGVQNEPSNYEQLGSRHTIPATYEKLGMAEPTR